MDKMDAYHELIKENIGYGILVHDRPYDREHLDDFVELIAVICCSSRGSIRIYILSALFNVPVTISQYYASLVRHDMANGLGGG